MENIENTEDFGARLRIARTQAGLTQSVVAAHMDKGGATISDWEKGKSEPTLKEILTLAKILKVSPAKLAFGNSVAESQISLRKRHAPEARALFSLLEKSIDAASNDPMRIGWLHEQMRVHLTPPIHWTKNLTDQEIIAGSYEIEKDLREADERRRHGQSVG